MTSQLAEKTLSGRLKDETRTLHEQMHALMGQGKPFSSREAYSKFVAAQYLFQRDIEHLFADQSVQAAVADLDSRGRQQASRDDLTDLGAPIPDEPLASEHVTMPEALGWLYVSEGSTLGAAFLFKEAQNVLGLSERFGARNLAAYPEGRAKVWRRFVDTLDSEAIPVTEHDHVIAGAKAAYHRFGGLLTRYFSLT